MRLSIDAVDPIYVDFVLTYYYVTRSRIPMESMPHVEH